MLGLVLALKKLFRALDTQLKIQARGVTSGEYDKPDLGLLKKIFSAISQPSSHSLQS